MWPRCISPSHCCNKGAIAVAVAAVVVAAVAAGVVAAASVASLRFLLRFGSIWLEQVFLGFE